MSNMAAQRRELRLADGAISFLEWKGEGHLSPLHFAHANGFNAQTYQRLLTPLGSHFHIRAWDARGHGRTNLPADSTTLRDWYPYRDDLIALLEDFSSEAGGPVFLGGHSMGATTSLLAAARRPDLVRAVFLVEPVIMPIGVRLLSKLSSLVGFNFGYPTLIQGARRRRAVFSSRDEMLKRYRGRGAFSTWPEDIIRDYIEGGTHLRDDGQVELSCAPEWEAANFSAQGHNSYAALKKYLGPMALLYAGIGSTCRPPAPKRIATRGGKTKVLQLEEATHFLPMEFPEIVRREILTFDDAIGKI